MKGSITKLASEAKYPGTNAGFCCRMLIYILVAVGCAALGVSP